MPKYIDAFMIPVSRKKMKACLALEKSSRRLWLEHGALEYIITAGDEIHVDHGLPFPKLMKLKSDENAVMVWIIYKSKAHRDRVNDQVLKDPRLEKLAEPAKMAFNSKRMSAGGFQVMSGR